MYINNHLNNELLNPFEVYHAKKTFDLIFSKM